MIRFRKARLSAGIVVGVAALVTPLAAISATATTAAAAATAATYHGTPGAAKRLTQTASVSSLPKVASAFRNEGPRALTPLGLRGPSAVGAGVAPAESVSTASGAVSHSGVIAAFNGLSDLNSDNLNGFPVTPPDQGLCVGRDATLAGAPKAVWEPINLADRETTPGGALLRPDVSLATLFQDPFAEGDVRCLYDQQTRASTSPRSASPSLLARRPMRTTPPPMWWS